PSSCSWRRASSDPGERHRNALPDPFDSPRGAALVFAAVPPLRRVREAGREPRSGPSVRLTLDGAEPYDCGSAPRAVTPRRCTLTIEERQETSVHRCASRNTLGADETRV